MLESDYIRHCFGEHHIDVYESHGSSQEEALAKLALGIIDNRAEIMDGRTIRSIKFYESEGAWYTEALIG